MDQGQEVQIPPPRLARTQTGRGLRPASFCVRSSDYLGVFAPSVARIVGNRIRIKAALFPHHDTNCR